jgi:hypothetical protein
MMGMYGRISQIAWDYTAERIPTAHETFAEVLATNEESLLAAYQGYWAAKGALMRLEADDFAYLKGKQPAIVAAEKLVYQAADELSVFGDVYEVLADIEQDRGGTQTSLWSAATGVGT